MTFSFSHYKKQLELPVSIAPLVIFRIVFGALLFFMAIRTLALGWVDKFYIAPSFYFKFYAFEWVQPFGMPIIYLLFIAMIFSALAIMLGAFYRISSFLFFIIFTYFELLDVTHYLNHYYLISLLAFLMCWLPANRAYSIDVWRNKALHIETVPAWTILIIQLQLSLVYFFAGLAKLQTDWLLDAQPLRIWLSRQSNFPLIGPLLTWPIVAYLCSWFGAIFDLTIPFWLKWKKSRPLAYIFVVGFHIATGLLFNIGIFPWLMMALTLIFFSEFWHQKIITNFGLIFNLSKLKYRKKKASTRTNDIRLTKRIPILLMLFLCWQLLFPLRHWLYPGNVLWTEEGFRFAWKVMVVEKTGIAQFKVRDSSSDRESEVNNLDYLTEKQEAMMVYQPDLLLQFAKHLAKDFRDNKGYKNPIVTVDCFVSLNGRPARRFVDPDVDLAKVKMGRGHLDFILE